MFSVHSLSGLPLAPAPFRVHLDLPAGWTVLDLSRWREQLAAPPGLAALTPAERDAAVELVAELAEDSRNRGVAIAAVQRGRDEDDRSFSGSLTVGFYDSSPEPATADLVAAVAGATGLERATVPAGPLVLRRGVTRSMPSPLYPHARQYVVQALLALTGTSWSAVATGTAGEAAHAPLMDVVVRRVLLGLRLAEPESSRLG
jgi:hypothetical protein